MTPEEIKALRVNLGMTREELAVLIGVSYGTISNWETGNASPTRLGLKALRGLQPKR